MFIQAVMKVMLWDVLPVAIVLMIGYIVEKQL